MPWTAGTYGERSVKLHALDPRIIPSDQLAPQVFLDYAHAMTRLPELIQDLRASQEDSSQVAELEELTRTIPKLMGLLPAMVRDQADVRQNVAVATMISGLTRHLDNALPLALVS
jgi:nuclear pore complex protein Nup98-Nup96